MSEALKTVPLPSVLAQLIVWGGYFFLITFSFFIKLDVYRLSQICQNMLLGIVIIHILEASFAYRLASKSKENPNAIFWGGWTLVYGFFTINLLKKELRLK